jgi:hypothetical protein
VVVSLTPPSAETLPAQLYVKPVISEGDNF